MLLLPKRSSELDYWLNTGIRILTLWVSKISSDLKGIYKLTNKEGKDFFYIGIPEDFGFTGTEPFDRLEMIDSYYLGHKLGSSNNGWRKTVAVLRTY